MANSFDRKESKGSTFRRRSLFGRRKGKPLGPQRQQILDTWLPILKIKESALTEEATTDPQTIFSHIYQQYWLEIGFGNGEHLAGLLKRNPNYAYIGAEPFVSGMAAFLKDIQNDNKDNIRLLMDDALIIARSLKQCSLDGIYILNPDPWHKTRHHKRRIINQENLSIFSNILKKGGELIMTTDVPDLAEWMVTQASLHPDFEWTANKSSDWTIPPKDWIPTRYETKRAKNADAMCYLFFKKK